MKKMIIISIIAIVVIAAGLFWFKKPSQQVFKKATIQRGDIVMKILATGTVQPENRLEIKPPVAGRVEQVLVKEGQRVQKGQILAWLSSNERAALIDAARSQGPEELKKWEEMYKTTPLIAPINGMIILRNIENGQTFTINDAVLVMSDRLTVKAQVDETDLAQIHLKQKSEIVLDAYPDQTLPAIVDQMAFEAKTVNNVTTYLIDVLPTSSPEYLRSGMTANVTFVGDTKTNILLIPNEFIKYDNGKPTALTLEENKTVGHDLQLGVSDGKFTEILSGIEEKQIVVLPINKKEQKSTSPFSPMGGAKNEKENKSDDRA